MAAQKTKITISFTERQDTVLTREAKRLQITIGDLVRRICDAEIDRMTKPGTPADRLYPAAR